MKTSAIVVFALAASALIMSAQQQPKVPAPLHDLRAFGFGRFLAGAVLDQLYAEHQSFAAHVTHDSVTRMPIRHASDQKFADTPRIFDVSRLQQIHGRERRGRAHGVASKS